MLSVVNSSIHKECPGGISSCIGAMVQCLADKLVQCCKHYVHFILVTSVATFGHIFTVFVLHHLIACVDGYLMITS